MRSVPAMPCMPCCSWCGERELLQPPPAADGPFLSLVMFSSLHQHLIVCAALSSSRTPSTPEIDASRSSDCPAPRLPTFARRTESSGLHLLANSKICRMISFASKQRDPSAVHCSTLSVILYYAVVACSALTVHCSIGHARTRVH